MPLIIWGSKGVEGTLARGDFFCPQCRSTRGYTHKRLRSFFTLYWIPLFPLRELARFIECDWCGGQYDEAVLEFRPDLDHAKAVGEIGHAMRRIMVLTMLADGDVDDQEVSTIALLSAKLPGDTLSEEDVRAEVDEARSDGRGVAEYAGAIAGDLTDDGKELIVKTALAVAGADGVFDEREQELIATLAAALALPPERFAALLSDD